MSLMVAEHPELVLLDALFTTYIRYNRFRCDHGWDIDWMMAVRTIIYTGMSVCVEESNYAKVSTASWRIIS